MCAGVLLVAIAACSHVPVKTSGGRAAWTTPHVLRIADIADPDHLNPYLSTMDVTYDLSSLMYSYLVIADEHGRLTGDLATGVPTVANGGISSDGRTYVYHLHRGVLWHDGMRFTARDIVASWRAVVDPANDTLHREGYDRIAAIETPDDYTVIVHLKQRYPAFVSQFFAPLQEGGKPVLPAHVLAGMGNFNTGSLSSHPIGTGPFRFVSWQRGEKIVMERFDRYFKGVPKLRRIEYRILPDDNTMLNETRAHHIDLVIAPPQAQVDGYRSIEGVATELAPWNAQVLMIFNARKPALHDSAVRRAIAYAIDKKSIIAKISHNVGEISYNTYPRTALGYERLAPYGYDPERAQALLQKDGWVPGADGIRVRNGERLSFTLASITGAATLERMALDMQSELRTVGIDMSIKAYPYNTIFAIDGPIYRGIYDAAIYSQTLNWDPNVLDYVGCNLWYPKGENTFGYCNHDLDALEAAGLQTDDTARRIAIYRKAGRIIWHDLPYLPLYQYRRLIVHNNDLKNYSVNPTSTPWWNAYKWDI
jgi:peptide/nickel transport system substrate-binding protein